ncbi:hypothetical protein ACHZ98_21290 [Streptomyces sp. MAR4 CNY-716]
MASSPPSGTTSAASNRAAGCGTTYGERWVTVRRITGAGGGEQTYDVSGIGRHLRVLATDPARQQDLRLACRSCARCCAIR